ncbi:lipopolysaccharide biosynthesis protein [Donghicola sp. C2-DW-16]|uniref:Lipopolysaccharide biosynthesis protein n=1 Tax=Donghicola mangrovi TaxID=2729614 RepID=A0ABX2PJG3_9RHOB|nr:lipopolysaccharide biosynthesis protein [Donghicola mangrovi]NVO29137.1 lipopolysaccharide biosynthesis protein [Donghicola mangrovi]
MSEIRSSLLKGAFWIATGRVFTSILGVMSTLVMARLLMPEDFGLVAICTALIAILTSITDIPVSQALIQHDDPKDDHYHTAFAISVTRGAILALILALFSKVMVQLYDDNRLPNILYVMAVGIFIASLNNPRLVIFQRELIFRQTFFMQIGEKISGFILGLLTALIWHNYWALVVGALASEVMRTTLSYILCPFRPRLKFIHWREMLSFSIWLTLGSVVQTLNWRSMPLFFGAILPTQLLGQYSFGNRMANVVLDQLSQPIQQTLYPAFSRFKSQRDALRVAYLRVQGLMCLWIIPCAAGFATLAPILIVEIVGEKWLKAIPVMQIVAMTSALSATVAIQPIAMATGNTKKLFYRDLRAFLVRWPLILLGLALSWSNGAYAALIGAMLGAFGGAIVNVIWNMALVREISNLLIADQLKLIVRPLISSIVMAGIILAFDALLPSASISIFHILRFSVLFLLGIFSYAVSIFLLWSFTGRPIGAEVEAFKLIKGAFARILQSSKGVNN